MSEINYGSNLKSDFNDWWGAPTGLILIIGVLRYRPYELGLRRKPQLQGAVEPLLGLIDVSEGKLGHCHVVVAARVVWLNPHHPQEALQHLQSLPQVEVAQALVIVGLHQIRLTGSGLLIGLDTALKIEGSQHDSPQVDPGLDAIRVQLDCLRVGGHGLLAVVLGKVRVAGGHVSGSKLGLFRRSTAPAASQREQARQAPEQNGSRYSASPHQTLFLKNRSRDRSGSRRR